MRRLLITSKGELVFKFLIRHGAPHFSTDRPVASKGDMERAGEVHPELDAMPE
ncbi:hypothetical protein [Calycomorphotria hydatis]|uniref:hypothetical protein n=1 Tax=Calycomorphotria hydatis TaxID=2528027 RepID=UPI001E46296D|nr:hypothetical protein [Calycomorphotria hydatis]